jgi:UDPglucose 6-dehydrogenase
MLATDVTFVAVPTPAEEGGELSLRHLLPVCTRIGEALALKDSPHVVAITSTVMPGTVGGPLTDAIVAASGRRPDAKPTVVFVPECVALGSAIRDFLEPDFVLIGEPYPGAAPGLDDLFARVCRNHPPILRTRLVEAELAKLAINAFLATKVTFANALADIAARLEDCDVDAVTRVLGQDRRIAPRYLSGGMPFGGPCLPRDTAALGALAARTGAGPQLWDAVLAVNAALYAELIASVAAALPAAGCAGVYGLAHKPGTGVVEGSPGAELARALAGRGITTVAFDPEVGAGALGADVEVVCSLEECVARADVLVLAAPLQDGALPHAGEGAAPIVIDCWRSLRAAAEVVVAAGSPG